MQRSKFPGRGRTSFCTSALIILGTLFTLGSISAIAAVPKLVSFQGILKTAGGTPVANGSYPVTFKIYDAAAAGNVLWTEAQSVTTTSGIFTALLGGGGTPVPDSVFNDTTRYLGITVAPDPEMTPRQQLVSVPYDLNGWSTTGNGNTNPGRNFLGTTDNQALELRVKGLRALKIVPTFGAPNMIGGSPGNSIVGNVEGATIGGGGSGQVATADWATIAGGNANHAEAGSATVSGGSANFATGGYSTVAGGNANAGSNGFSTVGGGQANNASGSHSTIAGGDHNNASPSYATIGGGTFNLVSGGGQAPTIAGGANNTASAQYATVGGGWQNTASGDFATVGGGQLDTASGSNSTVPGGEKNKASGTNSFAAGQQAKANHNGSFVWADNTNADFASTAPNQFLIRASGGVGIGTNSPAGALDVVSTTGAFIVPRMTTVQRDALTAGNGMIIYNTTTNQFNFRENGAWVTK